MLEFECVMEYLAGRDFEMKNDAPARIERYRIVPKECSEPSSERISVREDGISMQFIAGVMQSDYGFGPVFDDFETVEPQDIDRMLASAGPYARRIVGVDIEKDGLEGACRMDLFVLTPEMEEYAARYPTIGCVQYDSKLPAHLLGEMDDRANEILKLFCGHTYQLELQNRHADPDGIDGMDIFDVEATTVGEMCEKCAGAISGRAFEEASLCAQDLIWGLRRDNRPDDLAVEENLAPAAPGL